MKADHLAEAVWEMANQPDVAQTVDKVLSSACSLTPAVEVGVFRRQPDRTVEIAGTSGTSAQRADELQLLYGEGPCLHAALSNNLCLLPDTCEDERWPRWSPEVAELGWRSVLSLPLSLGSETLGALNLYSPGVGSFADDDIDLAQAFASHASIALGLRISEERLRQAMSDQHLLGQAKGILMARYGITRERAQSELERRATTSGRGLGAVAEQIVRSHRLPETRR